MSDHLGDATGESRQNLLIRNSCRLGCLGLLMGLVGVGVIVALLSGDLRRDKPRAKSTDSSRRSDDTPLDVDVDDWGNVIVRAKTSQPNVRQLQSDGWSLRKSIAVFLGGPIWLGFVVYAVFFLLDRRVKLSLTGQGIEDCRKGLLIPWTEFRGVRLHSRYLNFVRIGALLYVGVSRSLMEYEVEVDVSGLDRGPEEIAQLVRERAPVAAIVSGAEESYRHDSKPEPGERERLGGKHPDRREVRDRNLLEEAECFYRQQQWEEARVAFERVLADPSYGQQADYVRRSLASLRKIKSKGGNAGSE